MHGRKYHWPAVFAVIALTCSPNLATAQENIAQPALAGDGYSTPASQNDRAASQMYFVSENAGNSNAELAARLAEVEKALKKAEDKAKADKEKAASIMSATPSGRIHIDTACFSQNDTDKRRVTNEKNGTEFRTARLAIVGGGFNVVKYQIEYDFAESSPKCKDTYFAISDLPLVQNIQIGHFKEPYSLDELTSDNYITFMERNVANDAMAPKRHIGAMLFGNTLHSQYSTYAIGYFTEYYSDGIKVQDDNMGGAVTMRGTWLPWYDEATEGRGLIHTGLAYSYRDPYMNQCIISYRPESHLASKNELSMTDVSSRNEVGAELAMVYGPFSIQSECYLNQIDRTAHADCQTKGAYAYVSYFLTGEHRPYDRKRGVFGRVKPFENFFRVRDENGNTYTGKGAWELKYRYSWFDGYDNGLVVNNTGVVGTTCGDHTVGVNWYLNPYTRFMVEYIHSGINKETGYGVGGLDILQARAQIDF